jgi:hypothetical protein
MQDNAGGSRAERRRKPRLCLTRSLIARYGAQGAVIVDINENGARIEHFASLTPGRSASLCFDWKATRIECPATVVTCRVHRFADGDHGGTVYQSGLSFGELSASAAAGLKELMSTFVARSVAEQVANLKGLGPVTERDMPVFRSGVVAADGIDPAQASSKRTPIARPHHGYMRCALDDGRRWEKRWTRNPQQPDDGFTVLATEPRELVDLLCDDYMRSDNVTKGLIRLLARVTVEDSLK